MVADLALEFKVQAFIYSSKIPLAAHKYALDPSDTSKRTIELYCQELGARGLNWM